MQSRRRFLGLAGAGVAAAAGCDRLPRLPWLGEQGGAAAAGARPDPRLLPADRLLRRATYGPRPGESARVAAMGLDAWIEEQLSPESIRDPKTFWLVRRIETVSLETPDLFDYAAETALSDLRRAAVLRAVSSERQLLEVMVELWRDHFSVYAEKGHCAWLVIPYERALRRHALGSFRDLLGAVTTSPAMLEYLDGGANVRAKPNENHARELLELHTLGVEGGYTQADVMELSRAMTGWRVRNGFQRGRTAFERASHDDSLKRILGASYTAGASRDLDAILDRLAVHPATARRIAGKLCRRFAGDPPPPNLELRVAQAFESSRGDIRTTLSVLLHAKDLLRNGRPVFRRPYAYAVAALRALGSTSDGGLQLQRAIAAMGQLPYDWPTPDGYPSGEAHWAARALPRWNYALALTANRIPGTKTRLDPARSPSAVTSELIGRELAEVERRALDSAGEPEGFALALCHPEFQYA